MTLGRRPRLLPHPQELERRAGGQDGNGGEGKAGADQARLALLYEELTSEHKALDLILEALKELKAQAPAPEATPAPGTPCK